MYYELIDFLPQIPDHLIDDLETIETYHNFFRPDAFVEKYGKKYQKNYTEMYANYQAPDKLYSFLQPYFNNEISIRYQVIKKPLGAHRDGCAVPLKYNYIIDTGGSGVKTRWWNDVAENATELLHEVESKPLQWHRLNVWEPHSVTAPSRPRISIAIVNS